MAMPGWLEAALSELQLGVAEVPGPASNPRISTYLGKVGQAPDDEIPWCAAFVGFCLWEAGLPGTGLPNARSYLNWGVPSEARLGAVVVLWRGAPDGWSGHVGFLMDQNDSTVYLLGGNQGDRVSVSAFPKSRVLGMRWPN